MVTQPSTSKSHKAPGSAGGVKKPGTGSAGPSSMASSSANDGTNGGQLKATAKHKEIVEGIMRDMGINLYDPALPVQLLDVAHKVTRQILSEAKEVAEYSGKKTLDADDVKFGIQTFEDGFKAKRPSRQFMMELATEKNAQPLPPIKQNFGLRLPNDRFCQVQPNYKFKGVPKRTAPAQADPSRMRTGRMTCGIKCARKQSSVFSGNGKWRRTTTKSIP
jgi:histone H3/H4